MWHYDGQSWASYAASDLIYAGNGIASFTVSGFSGYAVTGVPEPATLALLVVGSAALIFRRKGQ